MRKIGRPSDENTMTPLRLHVPLWPEGALHSVCTAVPSMSNRFSLPSAKNPSERLSGAQNGLSAPSVPAIGRVTPVSSERSQSRDCCSAVATYASVRRPATDRMTVATHLAGW